MADLTIEHVFTSPPKDVWRAFTDPVLLAHWYGPGIETIIHKLDVKPGGFWLNEMKFGEKSDLSRMEYQEVTDQKRLIWHHASADRDWNITANPMMPNWPMLMLTEVTFEPSGTGTTLTLTQSPMDASAEESATYAQMAPNMVKGWTMGFEMIDGLLSNG